MVDPAIGAKEVGDIFQHLPDSFWGSLDGHFVVQDASVRIVREKITQISSILPLISGLNPAYLARLVLQKS